ncbi:hypothetical protein MPER_09657 [Moniliophthora perniciosa FA553]|nr:hypothetical protein MPER_09657 [Moniliophthora perniciosa FA553]
MPIRQPSKRSCSDALQKHFRRPKTSGIFQRAGCAAAPTSFLHQILAMSSGDMTTASRSSPPRMRSQSRESMDSGPIPLTPSEVGSVRENESMSIPEAVPSPIYSEEFSKVIQAIQAEKFLREVAERDPYIPNPRLRLREPTERVNEERKPAQTESWERVLKEVSRHDEDMVQGWRDDIDTLLVFAGLFSAVVTAFVIE